MEQKCSIYVTLWVSIFVCPDLIDLIPDPIPITLGVCDTQALFNKGYITK